VFCTRYSDSDYGNECSAIDRVCKNRTYTEDEYARFVFIIEIIMLKRDILRISDEFFSVQTLPQLVTLYADSNIFSIPYHVTSYTILR